MSRDSVQISLIIASPNYLDVLACNIQNAYLMVNYREQVWVSAGPEFGSKAIKNILVRKSLYQLKSSGAAFMAFLAETLDAMGYRPSYADLWLRPAVKPDGFEYYEYIICYVDDVLCISRNLQKLMKIIQDYFKLKDNNI